MEDAPRMLSLDEYPSAEEALLLVQSLRFGPFTKEDWAAFSGCETQNPLIANTADATIVLDGAFVNIVRHNDLGGGALYEFVKKD